MLISTGIMLDSFKIIDGRDHIKNTPRTHNLLLPWFRSSRLRRMRIKSNSKNSNLSRHLLGLPY